MTGAVRLWGAKGEHAQKNEYKLWETQLNFESTFGRLAMRIPANPSPISVWTAAKQTYVTYPNKYRIQTVAAMLSISDFQTIANTGTQIVAKEKNLF